MATFKFKFILIKFHFLVENNIEEDIHVKEPLLSKSERDSFVGDSFWTGLIRRGLILNGTHS